MPDNCPCVNEPRDCPECEIEAERYRNEILEAVGRGVLSEEDVMRTIFGIMKSDEN